MVLCAEGATPLAGFARKPPVMEAASEKAPVVAPRAAVPAAAGVYKPCHDLDTYSAAVSPPVPAPPAVTLTEGVKVCVG